MPREVDLLDLQFERLSHLVGREFILELGSSLESLSSNPVLNPLLEAMAKEAIDIANAFRKHDDESIPKVVELRKALATRAPGADDSQAMPPANGNPGDAYWGSFAVFDKIAGKPAEEGDRRLPMTGTEDPSRTAKLLPIIRGKLDRLRHQRETAPRTFEYSEENLRPDLDDLSVALSNIENEHEHVWRGLLARKLTSPGMSAFHLTSFVADLNPTPRTRTGAIEDAVAMMNDALRDHWSGLAALRQQLFEGKKVARGKVDHAVQFEKSLRPHVERLHKELRMRLARQVAEREELSPQSSQPNQRDDVTDLRNKAEFNQEFRDAVNRGGRLGLLMIDIDNFKKVNDELGHPVGDRILRLTAAQVSGQAYPYADVFRYGGEEIAVVASDRSEAELHALAESIRSNVERASVILTDGTEKRVTVSIGAAVWNTSEVATSLVSRADRALYQAKESGRNRVAMAD